MGWIKRKIDEHACPLPELPGRATTMLGATRPLLGSTIHPGDLWECDDCTQRWAVGENQHDGLYWEMMTDADWWKVAKAGPQTAARSRLDPPS